MGQYSFHDLSKIGKKGAIEAGFLADTGAVCGKNPAVDPSIDAVGGRKHLIK